MATDMHDATEAASQVVGTVSCDALWRAAVSETGDSSAALRLQRILLSHVATGRMQQDAFLTWARVRRIHADEPLRWVTALSRNAAEGLDTFARWVRTLFTATSEAGENEQAAWCTDLAGFLRGEDYPDRLRCAILEGLGLDAGFTAALATAIRMASSEPARTPDSGEVDGPPVMNVDTQQDSMSNRPCLGPLENAIQRTDDATKTAQTDGNAAAVLIIDPPTVPTAVRCGICLDLNGDGE